jgi:hypothetical protein
METAQIRRDLIQEVVGSRARRDFRPTDLRHVRPARFQHEFFRKLVYK